MHGHMGTDPLEVGGLGRIKVSTIENALRIIITFSTEIKMCILDASDIITHKFWKIDFQNDVRFIVYKSISAEWSENDRESARNR